MSLQPGLQTLQATTAAALSQNPAMTHNHVEKEQQCVCHWFESWSGYQKEDFLRFLLDRAVPQNVDTLFEALNGMSVRDRPPSIFQCQLKLFGEWFAEWTDKERNDFMVWIAARDPVFAERFNQEVEKAKSQYQAQQNASIAQ